MAISNIFAILLGLIGCLALCRWIIQPALLSPLAKILPAHWSARFSGLWIFQKRFRQTDTFAVHDAHTRLGPIVRLGPNDVSVNSLAGLRTIYAGGFEKNDWFANRFSNYGLRPMFAMSGNEEHRRRKKAVGGLYANSMLMSSPALETIVRRVVSEQLMSRLREYARNGEAIEFYHVFFAATFDFITAYLFGMKVTSNLLSHADDAQQFSKVFKTRVEYVSWPQELPVLTRWLGKYGLLSLFVPPVVADLSLDWDYEGRMLNMLDKAEETIQRAEREKDEIAAEDWPYVYAQLRENLTVEKLSSSDAKEAPFREALAQQRLEIACEMTDHTFANFDTVSLTLLFLAWELSKMENAKWQERLRDEAVSVPRDSTAKAVDTLPILHAIIMETLRLHAATPGGSVRITPTGQLASFDIGTGHPVVFPPDVRIQSQAWTLHRNPSVFPEPETWNPGRWLDSSPDQLKEMHRWFWAFGSGSRMCAGKNFAMIEMKAVAVSIWREFYTEIVDGSGMIHNGGFVAGPLGNNGTYLKLRLHAIEEKA